MKLGYSILPWQSLPGLSQSEAIARGCHDIRAAGFNAVEVLLASTLSTDYGRRWLPFAEWPSSPKVVSDMEIFGWVASFGRAARENDLAVTTIFIEGEHINPETSQAERDQALVIAGLLHSLGADHLVVDGGPRRGGANRDQDIVTLAETLTSIAQEVAEVGIRLSFHPHIDTAVETKGEIELFFNHVGDEVGLTLDTAQVLAGGADPVELARASSSRLDYVHLKDIKLPAEGDLEHFSGPARYDAFSDLGTGDVAFPEFCATLDELGFDGPIIVEVDRSQDPAASAQTSRAYLRDTFGW